MCVNRGGGGGGGGILSESDQAALKASNVQEAAGQERYDRFREKMDAYVQKTQSSPPSKRAQEKVSAKYEREFEKLKASHTGIHTDLRSRYTKKLVDEYVAKNGMPVGMNRVGLDLRVDLGGAPLPLQRKIAKLDREIGGGFKVRSPRKPTKR